MANVAIILNTTKKLSNNEHPVALRVTHDYKRKYYTINSLLTDQTIKFRCNAEHFKSPEVEDNGLGKFRKSFPNYKECNEILKAKLDHAQKILKRYDDLEAPFVFEFFEAELKQKHVKRLTIEPNQEEIAQISISSYYEQQIEILEEQKREGTAGLYRENKRILSKFKPNALIKDVNFRFLESFEYWMRNERGNKDTTISVKMRNLQRVINQAIEDNLFNSEDYPFGEKKYSINKRLDHNTKKIAIKLDRISKLKELILIPGSALHFAQQIFLFSYYCRGMNFVDITYLKWKQVSDTHISYVRKKTRGKFEIPINQHNKPILDYFKTNYRLDGGFVFPIISIHQTIKQQYTRKKTAIKAVNDNLKKLATLIGEPNLRSIKHKFLLTPSFT